MHLIGIARIGQDAELRHTPNGDAVVNINCAFNYGRPGQDGNKPTQWAEFSLWGKRAEALVQHLKKGTAVSVCVEEPHIEEFQKRDGTSGSKLVGRVVGLEFAGGRREEGDRQAAPAPTARQARPAPNTVPDQFEDDIPF